MKADSVKRFAVTVGLFMPGTAYAQHIPTPIAVAILSPLLVIACAVALGVLERSWMVGAKHLGLILIWLVLFGIASYYVDNDYIIWTPILLYVLHALLIVFLIIKRIVSNRQVKTTE